MPTPTPTPTPLDVDASEFSPDIVLAAMRDALADFAADNKGDISLAGDLFEVLEILAAAPGSLRIVLAWEGDVGVTDNPDVNLEAHTYLVIVSTQRGMKRIKGEQLISGRAGQKPLYKLAAEAKAAVRGIIFEDGAGNRLRLLYRGSKPTALDTGVRLDSQELSFSLLAQAPQP
ncbi:MAG: hypothetical protein NT105_23705 [Verrucomicrobia bacterium]|nr:hypothetical protein [Verrucomicrobiota bacterium]